jgi:plasmid replication initiation protein
MKPISLDIDYTSKKKEHKIKQVLFSIHITGDDDA